jgi:REP-associated tyrosine transposase
VAWVNRELKEEQLETVRTSVNRGRPLGVETWVQRTAKRLGLEFTLRGPGRPRT